MAKLNPFPVNGPWSDWSDGWIDRQQEALIRLVEQSRRNQDPDGIMMAVLRFPVADGHAYYQVQKKKPFTIAHIPFLDGYQLPEAFIRGLQLSDVSSYKIRIMGRVP